MRVGALVTLVASAVGLLCVVAAPGHAALLIGAQGNCQTNDLGFCLQFGSSEPIPVIRSFQFTAPSRGTALVTFNGYLQCSGPDDTWTVVDLASQIVASSSDIPNLYDQGGLRHAVVLGGEAYFWRSFNLASTRVFPVAAAGTRTYYFKIARLRMDSGTFCNVMNAQFRVTFASHS